MSRLFNDITLSVHILRWWTAPAAFPKPPCIGSKSIVGHSLVLCSGGTVITSYLLTFLGLLFEDAIGNGEDIECLESRMAGPVYIAADA